MHNLKALLRMPKVTEQRLDAFQLTEIAGSRCALETASVFKTIKNAGVAQEVFRLKP
jgi:hypothetical protein|tara:strand:- start:127 stop:297 length:171 start_codon:yes stop_codon:yes gene_type:complete